MSKFSDFFAEVDQPKFVSRMAGVMARNTADANRKASVMSRPQGETWKPEYEQEPALEAPMVSPDDLIGTGIPSKLAGLATMGAKALAGHGAMGGLLGTVSGGKVAEALNAIHGSKLDAYLIETPKGITLSKIVVPKGDRSAGAGTAFMKDLVGMADEAGQQVNLSPASDFGGSKSRLIDFYKRFGFVQNKGRAKDFAISESMYRNPTEAGQ